MAEALLLAAAVVAAVALAGRVAARRRGFLADPRTWLWSFGVGVPASAASALIAHDRHAGTGISRDHGWPKPFWFQWQSWENSAQSQGFNALYFVGNAAVWAAALLALLALVRLVRR
jgi:hypothetical protein